jgi:bifunctional UDP-N-acetylglucosamine pyrophosphorylase/glucosamine-1-phosphate N-acetyltransferase
MKSRIPKVLHPLCGRSMLGHALTVAAGLEPRRLVVVAGHGREQVSAEAARYAPDVCVVVQDRLAGTGHAVRMVTEALGVLHGTVVVTYGDMPLLRGETLGALVREHAAAGNAVTVLTARVGDPFGYGRIVRDADGALAQIVEQADATPEQQAISEINSGCYAFDGDLLAADPGAIQGVNDRVQLAQVRREYNGRLLETWMRAGVTIMDPAATWIDVGVTLAPDVEILPGTYLEGTTAIQAGARIGPGCLLRDTSVGQDATVMYAVCESAEIGRGASVGPYARLRPGTRIGPEAHIGTYVELKNATVGEGSKVPHLTYVGDADIGEQSNIGAATVFVNYDGVAKHHSTVGDHVRIGSDTMLVAPVTIGDGAFTAAGSVITQDVPAGALGIARGQQHNSRGWTERRHPGSSPAEAAARARSTEPDDASGPPASAAPAGTEEPAGTEQAAGTERPAATGQPARAEDKGAQGQ